jgi:hypothetical protein
MGPFLINGFINGKNRQGPEQPLGAIRGDDDGPYRGQKGNAQQEGRIKTGLLTSEHIFPQAVQHDCEQGPDDYPTQPYAEFPRPGYFRKDPNQEADHRGVVIVPPLEVARPGEIIRFIRGQLDPLEVEEAKDPRPH